MTPKEKAIELSMKFDRYGMTDNAKQCALIAVEFAQENTLNTEGYNKYLDEIKQEIELL
jgi:hypothetical protein